VTRTAKRPRWAWVAHMVDGTSAMFRGRCTRCPWTGPIRTVPVLDAATREAAAHASGPVADAATAAYRDLAGHMNRTHGMKILPPTTDQLTFTLGGP